MKNDLEIIRKIVVIIPVYKPQINRFEKKSLITCLELLSFYSIYLIFPDGLNISSYERIFIRKGITINKKSYRQSYFNGLAGYSHLMTSLALYEDFIDFDAMLVYQLDAYIFRQDIPYWYNRGFDFIGALLPPDVMHMIDCKHRLDFKKPLESSAILMNGGFSLRSIKALIEVIKDNTRYISTMLEHNWHEDVIFSLLLQSKKRLPTYEEATKFSFESYPDAAYKKNGRRLPTGCHAWYRNDFGVYDNEFWFKKIIPVYYYRKKVRGYLERLYQRNVNRLKRCYVFFDRMT